MPYKYIGRTNDFLGKTLWEIVGNLKNFGVGRVVVRNRFRRYPEPSYMKIVKVETLPNPENPSLDDVRKVKVMVEKTFRGVTTPKLVTIMESSYKADYQLLSKEEEAVYCKPISKEQTAKVKTVGSTMELPPLMKELLKRELIAQKKPLSEIPKIPIVLKTSPNSHYRLAKEGETPTVEITSGIGKPVAPRLYETK